MANDADVSEQFIKIPMAMQKAFCRIRIPGEARQVLDSIIRWTIGWQQRTKHEISIGLLCKMTDIKRSNVIRSVKCLEDMHIILSDRANRITAYEINLSYEEWQSKPKHKTGIINSMIKFFIQAAAGIISPIELMFARRFNEGVGS